MIDPTFLDIKFTEITLLHILILLGIPYIFFYFFERFTKFDTFIEKWEAGLFIFVSGGTITLLSLFFMEFKIPFWFSYILFIFILFLVLIIWGLNFRNQRQENSEKWVLIKLKDGKRFEGIIYKSSPYFIQIKRGRCEKIIEIDKKNKKMRRDWNNIQFNTAEILGIYSL